MNDILTTYKSWRFKNTALLVISLIAVFTFANTTTGETVISSIAHMGYVGSFVAGIFFVSTFTVAPAGIVLYNMASIHNPIIISLCAGLGGVVGDYVIFRFLKDNVFQELIPVFKKLGGTHLTRIMSTPYFAWLAPVIGAIIIASPFPDEIGVGLMGISKLKNWQFLTVSLILNTLGIFVIITVRGLFRLT